MNHKTSLMIEQRPSDGDRERNKCCVQPNEMTNIISPNEEYPPKIFKLDIDCFDEIFEYLSMKDLHSLGQTCKAMQQVAGEYFKLNHSAAEKFCAKDGIYSTYSDRDGDVNERIQMSTFNQFMPCISHYYGVLGPIRYLQSHANEFSSTNHIYFVSLFLNLEKIEFIKNLLPQIKIIQIRNCSMSRNFYELMLKYCVNLKCIYIQNADSSYNGKHEWLLQEYPLLEQLELMPSYPIVVEELETFFKLNHKVKRFSTSARFLWINRNEFLKSNIKLDILEIKAEYFSEFDESGNKMEIWNLLNQLYESGFYKRLFLYTDRIDQDLSDKVTSINGIETLCLRKFLKPYTLPQLTNLKELCLLDGANPNDMKIFANSFKKIQRLYIEKGTIDDILPFIRQSTRLHKIKLFLKGDNDQQRDQEDDYDPAYKFWYYEDETNANQQQQQQNNNVQVMEKSTSNWRILDLIALNKEREKLAGARKVTIFVRDDVFLATKWATKNGDINLNLIEMKRSDSFEWNNHF